MSSSPFATPALWFPGQDPEEFEYEIQRMLTRSRLTAAWERGEISIFEWMDAMDELGVDLIQASSDWAAGISYV